MSESAPNLKEEIKQAIVRSLRLPIAPTTSATAHRCSAKGWGSIRSTCSSSCSRSSARSACRSPTNRPAHGAALGRRHRRLHHRRRAQDAGMNAAPRGRPRANAITVDVEEWFHICGVGALGRPTGTRSPPRRRHDAPAARGAGRAGARATFFVVGWVAERHPALVAEILAAGHEVGSHGHLHARVYELRDGVRRRPAAERARARGGRGGLRDGVPGPGVVDQQPRAVGARRLVPEGFTVDASMAPVRLVGSADSSGRPHGGTRRPARSSRCPRSWRTASVR